ncbi:MAG: hypothetical protein D4R82_06050, partial [Dehalococcoidia bacterium]
APIVIHHGKAKALRYMFIILLIVIPCECHLSIRSYLHPMQRQSHKKLKGKMQKATTEILSTKSGILNNI